MILWTVILWRLEAGLGRSGNGNRRGSRSRRSWVSLGWADRGSRSRSRRRGSRRLALCLSSLSVMASRRHRSVARSLRHGVGLSLSFLLFPLVFQFLLSPFGFGLLRLRFFPLFLFIYFFLLWIDMGYGLMSSALGWPWPDDGLGEGGQEQKFQGGPSPYFFFLEIFYLLKNFFFGPRGGSGPLSLVPGSVPGLWG